jgi:hemoglobin
MLASTAVEGTSSALSNTVFERYGGFASVRKVVSDFYDRVLESPDLLPYFERIECAD